MNVDWRDMKTVGDIEFIEPADCSCQSQRARLMIGLCNRRIIIKALKVSMSAEWEYRIEQTKLI